MEKVNSVDISQENALNLQRFKIVFVGDVSVGKTSIINQIMDSKIKEDYEPSVGVDFFSKTIRYKNKHIKLQVWDSAGQEKYRSLIPNYIRGSSIVFLVYDITKKESFDSLDNWVKFINDHEKTAIVLCGNKTDLNDMRVISIDQSKAMAEKYDMMLFEVSAKSGNGIKRMLYTSVADLPYFQQFNDDLEKVVGDLEMNNTATVDNINTNRTNLSILEQSKGSIKFSRLDNLNSTEASEKEKKKCNC